MFKKVLEELGKVFSTREPISASQASAAAEKLEELKQKEDERLEKTDTELKTKSAEELCELKDGMTVEELRAHLQNLYKRHNRAASSLDARRRDEAEVMLNAIVEVRQRYLDKAID